MRDAPHGAEVPPITGMTPEPQMPFVPGGLIEVVRPEF
jgi:hypothetical protein